MLSSLEDEIVPAVQMAQLYKAAVGSKACSMECFHAGHNDLCAGPGGCLDQWVQMGKRRQKILGC